MPATADVVQKGVYIYKILPHAPPSPIPEILPLSDLDKNDGFIHLSTFDQVPATAARFFANHNQLWLLRLKQDTFGSQASESNSKGHLVWEASGSHGIFPHLYDGNLGQNVVDEVMSFNKSTDEDWREVLSGLPA